MRMKCLIPLEYITQKLNGGKLLSGDLIFRHTKRVSGSKFVAAIGRDVLQQ